MKLERIDLLRGIAIILVFFFHVLIAVIPGINIIKYEGSIVDYSAYTLKELILVFSPIAYGHTGVQLFLVLSGFLIHYNYLNRGKTLDYVTFMNRRFWRISPPYFLCLCFFSVFFWYGWKGFILHASLLHNFTDKDLYKINPSFWSLALEFQLYLIYPFYLYLNKSLGSSKTLYLIALMAAVLVIVGIALNIESQAYNKFLFKNWITWALGAHIAEGYTRKKRFYNGSWISIIALGSVIMMSKCFRLYEHVNVYLFSVFYAVLLDKTINMESKKESKIKLISSVISFIGIISYSLYLIHQPFLFEILKFTGLTPFSILRVIFSSILSFLILIALSYGFYVLIEKPSIAIGKKIEIWRGENRRKTVLQHHSQIV